MQVVPVEKIHHMGKGGVAASWSSPAALWRRSPVKCHTISPTPTLWSNRE